MYNYDHDSKAALFAKRIQNSILKNMIMMNLLDPLVACTKNQKT